MNPLRQIEQEVLARGREWTRSQLEEQLQEIANALPAVCAQSRLPLKKTRWRSLQVDTVAGVVMLRVRHGYSPAQARWVCPAREHWGLLPYGRKSPELQARLAYTATVVGSYAEAEAMAETWGTPVSDRCVFHQVKRLGEKAGKLELPMPTPRKAKPAFSLVVMMDGWMARERGADWGAGPRAKDPQRVEWREIKSAVIYRLEQRVENAKGRGLLLEKHAVATPPQTSPLDFGAFVQRHLFFPIPLPQERMLPKNWHAAGLIHLEMDKGRGPERGRDLDPLLDVGVPGGSCRSRNWRLARTAGRVAFGEG